MKIMDSFLLQLTNFLNNCVASLLISLNLLSGANTWSVQVAIQATDGREIGPKLLCRCLNDLKNNNQYIYSDNLFQPFP